MAQLESMSDWSRSNENEADVQPGPVANQAPVTGEAGAGDKTCNSQQSLDTTATEERAPILQPASPR